MPRLRTLAALIVVLGGGLAAALVQPTQAMLPPLPTVTVTVPPLPPAPVPPPPPPPPVPVPVPVPVPPPPPLPVPPPAPVPTPPPPPLPTPPAVSITTGAPPAATSPASPPESRSASSAGPAAPTFGPSSSGGEAESTESPRARSSAERPQQRRLEARTERSAHRVAVRLVFVLPKARRMFLIVRGPLPSCRVVGVVPVRGRAGENVVRFAGRVRGRLLDEGVYRLTLSPQRRIVPRAQTELVRVASPRRTVPLPESARAPSCASAATFAAARLLRTDSGTPTGPATPTRPSAPLLPPSQPGDDGFGGVISEFVPDAGAIADAEGGSGSPSLELVVIAIVGAALLGMLAFSAVAVGRARRDF